jgi:nicotinate-nucleotide--dimethylbenzimidazole phosphoribosyltransferase
LEQPTQRRLDNLTKPPGSLGRLEDLAKRVVMITGNERPSLERLVIFTMAGDHGVVEENVSAFPPEVTPQMVYNFLRGGAGINVLARHVRAKVVVVDMGVAEDLNPSEGLLIKKVSYGTRNMAKGPAMSREEAIRSIEAGIETFEEEYLKNGIDLVGTGDMGIGNTTPSSAMAAVFTGKPIEIVTSRGTGITDEVLQNKISVIRQALSINKPNASDPIDVLAKVGGFEIGGIAGVILAASSRRIPVVVDGFISSAGALLAYKLEPKTKEFMFAAHLSVESGHRFILEEIGLKPLLDLDLRLGEGTGSALAMHVILAGVKILNEMATFSEAGVSEKL